MNQPRFANIFMQMIMFCLQRVYSEIQDILGTWKAGIQHALNS